MVLAQMSLLVWCLALLSLFSGNSAFFVKRDSLPVLRVKDQVPNDSGLVGRVPPGFVSVRGGGTEVQQVATQAELEEILSQSGDALVVIDFTATWCGPCQRIAPAYAQLSQELTDVVFLKVDVDENEETAQKYEVFQMPTFLFMRKGEVVEQFSGANVEVLRQKINGLGGRGAKLGDDQQMDD